MPVIRRYNIQILKCNKIAGLFVSRKRKINEASLKAIKVSS